jgi:hypothetical protein
VKYFLFGGAVNVGKTEAVAHLAHHLLGRGFRDINNLFPAIQKLQPDPDFCTLLEGLDANNKNIRVIVNSATDQQSNIDALVDFCHANSPYDIVVSSVRCEGYPIRQYFFTQLAINSSDIVMELPMASVSAHHNNYQQMRQWYADKINTIVHILLATPPFFI